MRLLFPIALISVVTLSACVPDPDHYKNVEQLAPQNNLTVGKVQKDIKVGMPASEVAVLLGSPNIVTSEEGGKETWIYDKVRTDVAYSGSTRRQDQFMGTLWSGKGVGTQTQKTLTVVVKFDANKKVRDFAYHQSTF